MWLSTRTRARCGSDRSARAGCRRESPSSAGARTRRRFFEEGRNRFEHAVDACDVARGTFDLDDAADVGKDGVAVDRV